MPYISSYSVDKIKSEIQIEDIIGSFVSLKKKGALLEACCPFHNESTPSFIVNPAKQFYKCFGCGKSGDTIDFVMSYEKVEFAGALEKIASILNINIEYKEQTEEEVKAVEIKKTIFDATKFAANYYKQKLTPETEAFKYLLSREIDENDIQKWNLGYADGTGYIKNYALETGQIANFTKASLLNNNSTGSISYDFFKNRLIIPIIDDRNNIVSFASRALAGELPKYINGKNTDIYNKSEILFGINKFLQKDRNKPYVVLVEGYFHVISLHKIGYTNSLAYCGNALTAKHIKILNKLANEVVIFYDNDENKKTNTGLNSTLQQVDFLIAEGFIVKVFTAGIGQDADDFAREILEKKEDEVLFDLRSEAKDAIEWKCNLFLSEAKKPADIATAKNEISNLLYRIKDDTLRNEYLRYVGKTFKIKETELRIIINKIEDDAKKKAELIRKDKILDDTEYPEWYTVEHKSHMVRFFFTQRKENEHTGYYFHDNKWQPVRQSNFVILPLYTIKSASNPRRMCEVFGYNMITNRMISEVMDFDEKQILKLDQFESRLAKQSPFLLLEGYTKSSHNKLKNKLLLQFEDCEELNTLGYQPEQFWAFSDRCFEFPNQENPNGLEREYNEYGVVKMDDKNYLSESKNKSVEQIRIDNNNPYENDLFFIYKKSQLNFSKWADLNNKVYGEDKSWLAVSFIVITIFKDIISNFTKIPHLHCYGEKGSGKSEFAESIFHLFFSGKDSLGKLYSAFNLTGGGTPYAFHRRLERFRNCPQLLNEYDDTNIFNEFFDAIKATFDGEGRERGSGIKGKSEIMKRNATLVLMGQKIGNRDDNSVLTRSVTIEFLKPDTYTEEARTLMDELKKQQKAGLSSIILEVLSHRSFFAKRFKEEFYKYNTELNNKVSNVYQKTEARLINSFAALSLTYNIVGEIINLPLSAEIIKNKAFNKALEMHQHLQSTDGLSEFWKVIEFLLDRNEIEEEWDFKIRSVTNVKIRSTKDGKNVDQFIHFTGEKKLIYIRLSQLHQFYCLHVNRASKGEKPLTEKTISTYLSSQPYWLGLCPATGFKSELKNKSKDGTSCYVLDYDKIGISLETSNFQDEREEETIKGIVHKMYETSSAQLKFMVISTTKIKAEPIDKTKEQYTTCYVNPTLDENQNIKPDAKISLRGMVSSNNKGFRNMDVIEILPYAEHEKLADIF